MDDIGDSSFVNLDDYRDTNVDSSDGRGSEKNDDSPGEKEVAVGDCFKSMIDLTTDDIMGLEFESEAEACDFYSTYAKCHGFIMRRDDVGRDLKGNIIMRQLVCNKEGSRNKKHLMRVDRKRDHKPITRTNCPARLRVHLDYRKRKWKVVSFEESHNHEIISAKNPPLIHTYSGTINANKAADDLHLCGVRTCHIMGFMLAQKAGYSGIGFCKKDVHNHPNRQKHTVIDDGDVYAALSYIQAKADNDQMLFSKYTVTSDGKLKDLFWADGASRTDFQCFGDILAFDMTCEKSKYNNHVVIFSGCNHHFQTIIFGCALVADKTVETCKWLLESFWEAMCGKHPKAVVTDGDSAMRDAIKVVFPNASHRLCSCHLLNNASEYVENDEFLEDFKVAIYSNFSPEEFEEHWKNMIAKYGLQGNNWVLETYDNKSMWATAYLRDKFFGYIRTISQCEGINSLINSHFKRENNIVDFLHGFELTLREYRYNELMADLESMYSEPVMTTFLYEIEKDASKIFTREIFKEVKAQIESVGALNVVERLQSGNDLIFKMNVYGSRDTEFHVVYDKLKHIFLCNCRLFESRGIPCGHVICAMKHEHIGSFPSSLICKRWIKTAKCDYISSIPSEEVHFENMMMIRFGALFAACNRLCHIAAKNTLNFNEAIDEITKLTDKLQKRDSNGTQSSSVEIVGDPLLKTKGAPSKKNSWGKRRRCSNCNRTGHIIRRCPKLLAGVDDLTVDDDLSSSDSDDTKTETNNDKGGMSCDQNNVDQFESTQTSNANDNMAEVKHDGGTRVKQKKKICSTQDSVKDSKMKSNDPNIMLPQYLMNTSFAPPQNLAPNYGLLSQGVPAIPQYGGIPVYPQFPQVFPQYPVSVYPPMPQFLNGVQNVNDGRTRRELLPQVSNNGGPTPSSSNTMGHPPGKIHEKKPR